MLWTFKATHAFQSMETREITSMGRYVIVSLYLCANARERPAVGIVSGSVRCSHFRKVAFSLSGPDRSQLGIQNATFRVVLLHECALPGETRLVMLSTPESCRGYSGHTMHETAPDCFGRACAGLGPHTLYAPP